MDTTSHPQNALEAGEQTARDWFAQLIREALMSLYDPAVVRKSPLAAILQIPANRDVVSELRRCLSNAVEAQRPASGTPHDSRAWRTYHILRRRYVEQNMQREVAHDLGLSTRQLQREETLARETLVDYLWSTYDVDKRTLPVNLMKQQHVQSAIMQGTEVDELSQVQLLELEQLKNATVPQMVSLLNLVKETLETIRPLLKPGSFGLDDTIQVPDVYVYVPILRQTLVSLFTAAVRSRVDGTLNIQFEVTSQEVKLRIPFMSEAAEAQIPNPLSADERSVLGRLMDSCGGTLRINESVIGGVLFDASLIFPLQTTVPILIIDDNADTRQLYQRYLSGTRYRAVDTGDSAHGLEMAIELQPRIIVLDVMMPDHDGWTLLGQLREHPETHSIAVIVCSIVPQSDLAAALGAAAFIRKPANRAQFLAALDHQMNLVEPGWLSAHQSS